MTTNNSDIETIVSQQSLLDTLIYHVLPYRSDKGKEKEITISSELAPLFHQAHKVTQSILNELAIQLKRTPAYGPNVDNHVATYRHLYNKYLQRGDLHKLEILTACFDISGAVDVLSMNIDLDVLVAYTLRDQCQSDPTDDDEVVFECYIGSAVNAPALFDTPGIQFEQLSNCYKYCVPMYRESYWLCVSAGWLQCPDYRYLFTIKKRQLTKAEMWHEITDDQERGHYLYNVDGDQLTRRQLIQSFNNSKI